MCKCLRWSSMQVLLQHCTAVRQNVRLAPRLYAASYAAVRYWFIGAVGWYVLRYM